MSLCQNSGNTSVASIVYSINSNNNIPDSVHRQHVSANELTLVKQRDTVVWKTQVSAVTKTVSAAQRVLQFYSLAYAIHM
jgi:hypothetical protein